MAVITVKGRSHQLVTTDGEVTLCYLTGLATGMSIPKVFFLIMPSVSIYQNTGGVAVPTRYLQEPGID